MRGVFASLHESLQGVLSDRLGWTELREVQEQTYGAVTRGNDVLVIAPTAGGKSEAALIPVIDNLIKNGRPGIACLYLSPLKALINDQEDRISRFCIPTGLTLAKWHGDVPKGNRVWKEGETPHILMITPESLEVLLHEPKLAASLRNLRYIIVDELHAFVESERGVHLKTLLYRLDRIADNPVQRIGLSATVGNPSEILAWLSDQRHGEELVAVEVPPKQKQFSFVIEPEEPARMDAVIRFIDKKKALVFVNSRREAENVMNAISPRAEHVYIHHSSVSSVMRQEAEEAFLREGGACIICTSTLELGIDIGDLDIVVQVGPPASVSSFLQRMGRSGRRGKAGYVAWVLSDACELLISVAILECAMHRRIEPLHPPENSLNVLAQQLLLNMLRTKRTTKKSLLATLHSLPPFSRIPRSVIEKIIDFAIAEGYLTMDGDMLMLGEASEKVFGTANYRDLYSVISGSETCRAVTPEGEIIGTLDARFVAGKKSGDFSLGGKVWQMVKFDESHNLVVVIPGSEQTSRAFWTGSDKAGYSTTICSAVQEIISRKGTLLPLPQKEQEILAERIFRMPAGIRKSGIFVRERGIAKRGEVVVYSFNGGSFNRLLTILVGRELGGKTRVRYSDFVLLIRNAGKEGAVRRIAKVIQRIQESDYETITARIGTAPPGSWKFERLLPPDLIREMTLSGQYRITDFIQGIRAAEIVVLESTSGDPDEDGDDHDGQIGG
ncbi:MAG TPA: DEAD/DEAH box helicase [Methanoregulaceae archaeon]|nr:DEAD/DEAH box helicase [Methanoregulaceae archaeon]HRY75682.1 DEAD/DEAH box helicase [Methanoregulaceae archaeon]